MKRFAPLALVVLALALVPVALGDDAAPAQPQATGHPIARLHVEILRLRLQLVRVRYRLVCRDRSSDRCTQFTQKLVDRLTTLDGNVQKKMDDLQCTSASTDERCTFLAEVDAKLKSLIQKLQSPASTTSDASLDRAAGDLGRLASQP